MFDKMRGGRRRPGIKRRGSRYRIVKAMRKSQKTNKLKQTSNINIPMKIRSHPIHRVESSGILRLRYTILLVAAASFVAGCAEAPPTVVHETVGPRAAVAGAEHAGYLTVYSGSYWTTPSTSDDVVPSVLSYTDYDIQGLDGSLFKHVENGDEEPARVLLPKGCYIVVAQSETSGTISVPVAIETRRITVVHLEQAQDSKKAFTGIDSADLVRLPDGQVIGFRARNADPVRLPPALMAARSKDHSSALEKPQG